MYSTLSDVTRCILDKFFLDDFFSLINRQVDLNETDEGGESTLHLIINGDMNLCIENLDKKNTSLNFLKTEKLYHLCKRVDHVVFSRQDNNQWNIHLIEMKSGIENIEKWREIKGKFRASYLLCKALAAILQIEINDIVMYTTYEHANLFQSNPTNPVMLRPLVGKPTPSAEWNGNAFAINFDPGKIKFNHIPIKMVRNKHQVLESSYTV